MVEFFFNFFMYPYSCAPCTSKFQEASRNAGLDFVNVFKMLYPRFTESLFDGHHLECIRSPECEGDLGKVAIQVAVERLNQLL